jgi:hypothetical protein
MKVKIQVLKAQIYDIVNDEYLEDYMEVEVDIPLIEIAEIIGERFGVEAQTMLKIIDYFDIDLDWEIENNEEIQELAQIKYCEEEE